MWALNFGAGIFFSIDFFDFFIFAIFFDIFYLPVQSLGGSGYSGIAVYFSHAVPLQFVSNLTIVIFNTNITPFSTENQSAFDTIWHDVSFNTNKIDKSILIQPNFERDGVNSKKWNLTLVAWSYNDNEDRLQWISYLVEEKKIKVIESDIENLLKISYEKLKNTKIDDLSKPY